MRVRQALPLAPPPPSLRRRRRISNTGGDQIVVLTANMSWVISVVTSGINAPLHLQFVGDVLYFGDALNYQVRLKPAQWHGLRAHHAPSPALWRRR
jgi:hypothetical protein